MAKFLVGKANSFWNDLDFRAYEDILALLIYGLVLFPNPDQLIDISTVKIFISLNPVPTLLGDILHSFHTHTIRKRGILMCCTTILERWFFLHLPLSVLKNEQGSRWSRRLMTLKHSDIHWCSRSKENVIIVEIGRASCRERV